MEVTAVGDRDTTAGRPRQAGLDDRIKSSAVDILGEHGFAGLSINRICRHAGIPRPTFYRRWPSAVAALIDAFNDRFDDALLVDGGDAAADLTAFAIAVRNRYDDPVVGTCLPAIYEAGRTAPDLIAPIMDAQRQRRKANVATLTRALGEQGIASVLSPFEILTTITAAIDQGYLARCPVGDDFLHRLVTALLR